MANRIATPSLNGTSHKSPKTARRGAKLVTARSVGSARLAITVGLGCAIPLLSLYLAAQGGALLGESWTACGLGVLCLTLCCASLGLSLSHLASAISDITRCGTRAAWALAVVLDCSLVASELANAAGHGTWLVYGFMASVTAASMALNCWAFLAGKGK